MAQRGKPLDMATILRLQRLSGVMSQRKTAKEADVSRNTVKKYTQPKSGT